MDEDERPVVSAALRWGWVISLVRVASQAGWLAARALLHRSDSVSDLDLRLFRLEAALDLLVPVAATSMAALALIAWFDHRSLRAPAALVAGPILALAVTAHAAPTGSDAGWLTVLGTLGYLASNAGQLWLAVAWGRLSAQRVNAWGMAVTLLLLAVDALFSLTSPGVPFWVWTAVNLLAHLGLAAAWFQVRAPAMQVAGEAARPKLSNGLGHLRRSLKAGLALVGVALLMALAVAGRSEFLTLVGVAGLPAVALYAAGSALVGSLRLIGASPASRTAAAAAGGLLAQAGALGAVHELWSRQRRLGFDDGLQTELDSPVLVALGVVGVGLLLWTLRRLGEEWLSGAAPKVEFGPWLAALLLVPALTFRAVSSGALSLVLGVAALAGVVMLLGKLSQLQGQLDGAAPPTEPVVAAKN